MPGIRDVVVVSASFDGVRSLCALIDKLPVPFAAPIVAVLHSFPSSPTVVVAKLARCTALPVALGSEGLMVKPGRVYLTPPDRQLVLASFNGLVGISSQPPAPGSAPADALFRSAAKCFGYRVIGVVLAGGRTPGLEGLRAINAAGGIGILEAKGDESAAWHLAAGMDSVYVLVLEEIAELLRRLIEGETPDA